MRLRAVHRAFGWVPDVPDHRDHLYAAPPAHLAPPPARADLRRSCPPVYDQGHLGSCTANAIAAAVEFDRKKERLAPVYVPSRLFIYYNERAIEHTVASDSGAQIRDGIKTVARDGECPESLWPYVVARFAEKPPENCYAEAVRHKAVQYQRVARQLAQMKGCLASGYPFVFGFAVYESFMSPAVARTGRAPMPGPKERQLGGHAVLAVGYDDAKEWFIVRNSWGSSWGSHGYFTLPYAYLLDENLSDDLWTIRVVE